MVHICQSQKLLLTGTVVQEHKKTATRLGISECRKLLQKTPNLTFRNLASHIQDGRKITL